MTEIKDKNYSENDKDKSFVEFGEFIVTEKSDNGEIISEDEKEGMQIKGKDCIYLNAPKIYPPQDPDLLPDGQYTPLLTEHQDIVGAINELFQSCSGGGDVFQVSGSGSGITVTMVKKRGGDDQELTVDFFTINTKKYKTVTTVSSGNTSIEKTWSKTVITEVFKDDKIMWKFSLDGNGNATAVFDSAGNDVLNGVTSADGNSIITPTPEGIALGWALAYNNEQSSALKKALDAYQDGIDDCDEVNEKEGIDCGCGDCGGGDGSGDDGSGSGTGGNGDGSGAKLPDKKFDAMELPDGAGAGCKLTYEIHIGYDVYYVTEYCDYAEYRIGQYNPHITRCNGVMYTTFNGSTTVSTYDRTDRSFTGITGIFELKVSGDIRDPEGMYS